MHVERCMLHVSVPQLLVILRYPPYAFLLATFSYVHQLKASATCLMTIGPQADTNDTDLPLARRCVIIVGSLYQRRQQGRHPKLAPACSFERAENA